MFKLDVVALLLLTWPMKLPPNFGMFWVMPPFQVVRPDSTDAPAPEPPAIEVVDGVDSDCVASCDVSAGR